MGFDPKTFILICGTWSQFVPEVRVGAHKSFFNPIIFCLYFVPEVGVGAQKSDFKSHLSFAFYFVPEVRVGA